MIFTAPPRSGADDAVSALIGSQRERLRSFTQYNVKRWFGSLRRTTFAREIRGSNSMDGYNISINAAVGVVDDEQPPDERTDTWNAIIGCRDATTCIMQASRNQYFEFGKQFLKSLHFMMIGFDMTMHPRHWRSGTVFLVSTKSGEAVYDSPGVQSQ